MKEYIITALIGSPQPPQPLESRTDIQRHRATHSAGIMKFDIVQSEIIAMSIKFTAQPCPIEPSLPNTKAQNAALKQLRAEIHERYPGSLKKTQFQIYQP